MGLLDRRGKRGVVGGVVALDIDARNRVLGLVQTLRAVSMSMTMTTSRIIDPVS